jgi:TetR/AcrR family transcriptional repressor of nem operon
MRSKRDLIIRAALARFRSAGILGSTLKDIADVSGVPLGNLYYYFKTRDELVLAVLDACERELAELLARLNGSSPADWLGAYFDWLLDGSEEAARLGCPFGTLATELRDMNDTASERAALMVETYRTAVRAQVQGLGLTQEDGDDAFLLVQGAYVVSRVAGERALFEHSISRLRKRLLEEHKAASSAP